MLKKKYSSRVVISFVNCRWKAKDKVKQVAESKSPIFAFKLSEDKISGLKEKGWWLTQEERHTEI